MRFNDYEFIFQRRHAHHQANRAVWERSAAAYAGGRDYIRRALIRHVSEIELEYAERLERACYFNYPRKIARLITQYATSVEPQRENADTELLEDFSRSGLRANEVMRQASTLLNVFGAAALVVEMPFFDGEVDQERKKAERLRPAARAVSPLHVADWAYGEDGRLQWILLDEEDFLDAGPFLPTVAVRRRKLWTRDAFYLFEKDQVSGIPVLLSHTRHALGEVPALLLFEPDGFGLRSRHYFEDVVRISDAILNNESEAQMNIIKQMFGLLVISDSFARSAQPTPEEGVGTQKFSHLLARSAALYETPEERGISRYISPSGVESAAIRAENQQLKKELFDVVGMSIQADSQQHQTAEAKAWDHHQVRQFLCCRADILEQAELAVWRLMGKFDPAIPMPRVTYNRDFSVIDLAGSVGALLQLRELNDNAEYRREVSRTALFLLEKLRKIAPEQRQRILNEIEGAMQND